MKKWIAIVRNEYVYSILMRVVGIGISLLQSVLLARYLGAELKGLSSYISSITSIGAIVITFGMHQAYPFLRKKYGKEAIRQDYISLMYILFGIYLCIAALVSAFLINSFELRVAILLIPVLGYSNVMAYVCLIETPNQRNTLWTIIGLLDIVYLTILILFTNSNVFWTISTLLFIDVARGVFFTVVLKCPLRLHKGLKSLWTELMKLGFFPMLALLMTTLNYRIDVLMLKAYQSIDIMQIGIYSIGINVADRIVLIPDTLKGILASKLSKGANESEVARVCRLSLWSSCVMAAVFWLIGEWGICFLYGKEYMDAYSVMAISATGAVVIGYFKLIAQYNIINKKQIVNVIILSISILSNAILNLIFVPLWGINGAAFATCISHLLCGIVFIVYFTKKTHIKLGQVIFIQKADYQRIRRFLR